MKRWRRIDGLDVGSGAYGWDFDADAVKAVGVTRGLNEFYLDIVLSEQTLQVLVAVAAYSPQDTHEAKNRIYKAAHARAEAVRAAFVRSLPGGEDDMATMREAAQKPGMVVQVDNGGSGGWIGELADRLNELLSGVDEEKAKRLGELWLKEEAVKGGSHGNE